MKRKTKEWLKAALIRCVRTFCWAVAGGITIGATLQDVDWRYCLSAGAVAVVYNLAANIGGLPEVDSTEVYDMTRRDR